MQPGIATATPPASRFWLVVALGAALVAAGLGAAHYMEVEGHIVTGMNNHVVWGLPHVFAIFLIVAASGVLNVASVGSVFGKALYKARAPLSGLLCLAMLAGGLMVLMLDLGRPDRLIVAATHYNFTSMFALNVFLYSGMAAIVGIYLWTLMERRMNRYSKKAGLAAFIWRLLLTTGTGSIFGFLVARQAYGSALLAPMFVIMSFAWGLAVFLLVQAAVYAWNGLTLPAEASRRMSRLLGVFVAATLYMVAMHHVTNLYFARQVDFERFILVDGGVYPLLFWIGYVAVGSIAPLVLIYAGDATKPRNAAVAAALVVAGAFCALYVFIIGGQAFPLELFPGAVARSTFYDGQVAPYAPSLPELLLGIGGVAAAFLLTAIGVHVLDFLPRDAEAAPASATGSG
ncbi:MAG: molybdopterin oxidoreductase [Lautropia sp. SCN 69-89]|nr:MAG: molybdopterin oxidoreductase [Lautropia sp. SCN 69-89]